MTIREMAEQREVGLFQPVCIPQQQVQGTRPGRAAMRYPSGLSKRPGSYFTF